MLPAAGAISPSSVAAAPAGGRTTYHGDNTRSGVDSSGASFSGVDAAWTSTLDGEVYASQ